ncbi:hypothetical protein F511_45287 [Dorcoceras hygrometricum]|uniref:Uncharacterized protein n=1 Tax=Dorcoceras hygrometricum TaxID=472368 RepID=A0A2Z7A3X9_9LAMI|nr:hypothetical protein F511_45287 [Dorcoceras hygrometricum]
MPADQQQPKQRNRYQQQWIRHAYVIISIDSSRDNFSNHLLNVHTSATAEFNSQHSKMLTNTCRFLAQSHATRDVCQQKLQFAPKPADLHASR